MSTSSEGGRSGYVVQFHQSGSFEVTSASLVTPVKTLLTRGSVPEL